MAQKTSIEWTEATWNPIRGCSRVSPGCGGGGSYSGASGERGGCYAEVIAARFSGPGQPFAGFAERTEHGGRWTGNVALIPELLDEPLRRRKPTTWFISMSDLFHEALQNEEIASVFGVMAAAHWHTFQVLTKRADRMVAWFRWIGGIRGGAGDARVLTCTSEAHLRMHPRYSEPHTKACWLVDPLKTWKADDEMPARLRVKWPLPNVWLGCSVEDRNRKARIDHLRRAPAAVRFLSIEPLLEDLGELDLAGIDQVIAGAESGHGARPMHEDWVRNIRNQATAQGAKFFYKQRLDERGHKVSLPMLDGRSWAEMPEVRA